MKKIFTVCTFILTLLAVNSCSKDDWAEFMLSNREWRVVEATYGAPYQRGDYFYFYSDGAFEFIGRGLHDTGSWRVRRGNLEIHFNGSPYSVDIVAPIPILESDYALLECYDYYYDISYDLRLVGGAYLDGYGYNNWYSKKKSPIEKKSDVTE